MAFPGYMKTFTVAYYLQGLVPHAMPNDGRRQRPAGPVPGESRGWRAACSGWLVIWIVFLALGAWVVERREYVLEQ